MRNFQLTTGKKPPSQSIPAQSMAPLGKTKKDQDILGSFPYFVEIADVIMLRLPCMVTAETIMLPTIFIRFAN